MQLARWGVTLLGLLGAVPAMAGSGDPVNFQGRIRANDAPIGGRLTIGAYFLDSLDVRAKHSGSGRFLLFRFHDSNGKNAFVVPADLAISGRHRTSFQLDLIPVGRTRVGGALKKDENRWAIWWVPKGERLEWQDPEDLNLQYGFSKSPFVPLSSAETAKILTLLPWPALEAAFVDSTPETDRAAIDAAAFDQPPVAKIRRDPPYPSSAKMYDFQGSLFVAAHVSVEGKVEDAYVLQSNAVHDLNVAALTAVMEWVFKPGLKAGKPVAGDIVIPIQFDLGAGK